MTRIAGGLALLLFPPALALLLGGCEGKDDDDEKEKEKGPAVEAAGGGLPVLSLTEKEEGSLGIRVEEARKEAVPREIELTGWVEPRPGASTEVRAPLAGHVLPASSWPSPGRRVERDEVLASLRPALALPERLQAQALLAEIEARAADGERDIARARAAHDLAGAQLERAKGLLAETAGSRKALDEAAFQRAAAAAELRAAEEKRASLAEARRRIAEGFEAPSPPDAAPKGSSGAPAAIPLRSPLAGTLVAARAAPGEYVEAGRPVFEVADLETIWIRVPVFEGDLDRVDPRAPLLLRLPGAPASSAAEARPAARSPAVDPARRTGDLFFELTNPERRLLRGESLAVRLATRESAEAVTVPAAAVVYDAAGGAWVYISRGDRRYARRRVETGAVSAGRVEVRRGLAAGDPVVEAGASELFGAEFGTGGGEEEEEEGR